MSRRKRLPALVFALIAATGIIAPLMMDDTPASHTLIVALRQIGGFSLLALVLVMFGRCDASGPKAQEAGADRGPRNDVQQA